MNIFLYVREYKGSMMLEISGAVYGKIIGNSIHDLCCKLSKSNAVPRGDGVVYIDESGFGKELAEEMEHFFKTSLTRFNPKRFYTRA